MSDDWGCGDILGAGIFFAILAVAVIIALQVATWIIAAAIALIGGYIGLLIRLWREGKKGWFWALFVPGATAAIFTVVFLGNQIAESNRQKALEKQRIAEEEYRKVEAQQQLEARFRDIPFYGVLSDIEEFDDSRYYSDERRWRVVYCFVFKPEKDVENLFEVANYDKYGFCSEFHAKSIHWWTINGETYEELSSRNSVDGTNDIFPQFTDPITYGFYLGVQGPDSKKIREVCIPVIAPSIYGGKEKMICIPCHYP